MRLDRPRLENVCYIAFMQLIAPLFQEQTEFYIIVWKAMRNWSSLVVQGLGSEGGSTTFHHLQDHADEKSEPSGSP